MKKITVVLVGALLITGMAFAQGVAPGAAPTQATAQAQVTKVTGKLELIQGVIGLKSGGKSYLLPRLQMLAGFVKGVEEGSTVTVEGYENALPYASDVVLLHATKLTVGGKDYDLGQTGGNFGNMGMFNRGMGGGMHQGMMQGNGRKGGRW
jgi:hypothetical protein